MSIQVKKRGMLLIISGPSGTGKGTLVKALMEKDSSFRFSCSITTRAPREGEIEGVHYNFVSPESFQTLIEQDAFLEYATVHGNCYGTLKEPVENDMENGYNVVLDIDPQGAIQVMENCSDYVSVFILPPSFDVLRTRLYTRNTDKEVEINRRLANARIEVTRMNRYQYAIINDTFAEAFEELYCIISAEKQRTTRYMPIISEQ